MSASSPAPDRLIRDVNPAVRYPLAPARPADIDSTFDAPDMPTTPSMPVGSKADENRADPENLRIEPLPVGTLPSPAAFNASLGFLSHPQSSQPQVLPPMGAFVRPVIAPATGLNDIDEMLVPRPPRNIDGLDAQTRRSSSGAVFARCVSRRKMASSEPMLDLIGGQTSDGTVSFSSSRKGTDLFTAACGATARSTQAAL